jgi:hypothetical protein
MHYSKSVLPPPYRLDSEEVNRAMTVREFPTAPFVEQAVIAQRRSEKKQ